MKLQDYRNALAALERSGAPAILAASFDLRPGTSGFETATNVLREAIRSNPTLAERPEREVADLADELAGVIEAAAGSGASGVFVAGPPEAPTRLRMDVSVPPRHSLRVGPRVSWFELERYAALTRPIVGSVWVDRSLFRATRVGDDAEPKVTELEADPHFMESSPGRTGMHGRGGSVSMPAGGHGKTRIERSAEEERERFAREAAALIERRLESAEAIVMHGPPEFEARVAAELPPRVLDRIVADRTIERAPSPDELAGEARARAAERQFEHAAELARQVSDGELGDRALRGPGALVSAARQGRLATLVLDEDAMGHLGDAMDARTHAPTQEPAEIEELLEAARASSAVAWFARRDVLPEGVGGAVGTLRW